MAKMKTIKVWDPFVRLFHWLLVTGVITQLATAEDYKNVHFTVGYAIAALLVLRIIWGFVGTRHARFKDFIYPPAEISAYLKGLIQLRPRHYIGHNPAGGAMVCALLLLTTLAALAGMKTLGAIGKGPLAFETMNVTAPAWAGDHRHDDDDSEAPRSHNVDIARAHFWKEIHETLVGIILFLIGLHLCGVIASSYVHRENLIGAMVTGDKKAT